MSRAVWAVALAAWFGFMVWKIDWLWSLSEPWLSFAQAVAVLSFLLFAAGALLSYKYAGVAQVVIGFFGVLALWGGVLTNL
ncbi:MAG: hypothetical protein LUG44_06935 [Clostridiales bacterium]|nr:hypothetical protein [Clostridiales bacterium]